LNTHNRLITPTPEKCADLQYCTKAFGRQALGELTALPGSPSVINGKRRRGEGRRKREQKGRQGEGEGWGKDTVPLLSDSYAHDSETPVLIQNSTISILIAVF